MKSSPDRTATPDAVEPLPPTLSSMWRLCRLGFRNERGLMALSLVTSQLASLPGALTALWLALLGAGVVQHEAPLALGAAVGMAVSAAASWFLQTISTRVQRRFA